MGVQSQPRHVLVGIGSLESSFVLRNVPAIDDVGNEDLAPLMLFYQHLVQLEVSFKIQYRVVHLVECGLLLTLNKGCG